LPGFARSDLHKIQYGVKTENDIKNRKLSCSGRIISLPNGENRAKIGKGTAEILWRIYTKFIFLVERQALAVRLDLYFRFVYFYLFYLSGNIFRTAEPISTKVCTVTATG